jgi:hypothetical protein
MTPPACAALALTLLALAPVLVAVITRSGDSYLPVRDLGTIDLRVRDVWTGEAPLIGPYSRYLWSHPGPLVFYLLAIPSGLFGQAAWATLVGGALLQGAAIAWLAKLAWQRGGLQLVAFALVGMGLAYGTMGPWIVVDPWNPHIVIPFFALFVLQMFLVAEGRARLLPGATFVGSFVVQTHIGYAPLVATAVLVAASFVVNDLRKGSTSRGQWRGPVLLSGGLALVLWLPPLLDSVLHWPGNFADLAHYFVGGGNSEPAIGFGTALELMAVEFRWLPPWLGGSNRVDVFGVSTARTSALYLLVPVVLMVAALVVARSTKPRAKAKAQGRFAVLACALFVAGALSLGRLTGVAYRYLFYWRPVLAVLVVVAFLAVMATRVPWERWRWARGVGLVSAAVAIAMTSGLLAVGVAEESAAPFEPVTRSLVRQLQQHGVPKRGVILRLDTDSLIQLQRGIFDELDRDGLPVRVDRDIAYEFGEHRGVDPSDVAAVWWVAENGSALTGLTALPGSRVIASSTPLSPAEEREIARLQHRVYGALEAADRQDLFIQLDSPLIGFSLAEVPGVDQTDLARLSALNEKMSHFPVTRSAVVAFRPEDAPRVLEP